MLWLWSKKYLMGLFLFCASFMLVYFSFPVSLGGYAVLAWFGFLPLFVLIYKTNNLVLRMLICCTFTQCLFALVFNVNPFQLTTSFYQPGNLWGTLFLFIVIPLAYGATIFLSCLFFGQPFLQAAIWTAGEMFVLQYLLSYPVSLALTQFNNLCVLQLCSVTGIYGITFLIIFFNAALFHALFCQDKTRFIYLGLALLMLCLVFFYGSYRLRHEVLAQNQEEYRIALVQPNHSWLFGASSHFNALIKQQYLDDYFSLTQKAKELYQPDLLVWPEGALKTAASAELLGQLKKWNTDLIYGGFSLDTLTNKPQNSIFCYSARNRAYLVYAKEKLAPLFETSLYVPGRQNQPFYLENKGVVLGPLVCFESLFSGLVRKQVLNGANVLLCLSNDAFFKGSNLVMLHAVYMLFRGVEFSRPVLFVNNNGLSLAGDPLGRILLISPFGKASVSGVGIDPCNKATFYYRFPYLTGGVIMLIIVVALFVKVRRKLVYRQANKNYTNDQQVC